MPNIKSAKKRVLITKKKNARNRSDRSKMNNAIKAFNKAIDAANIDEAERLLPITMSVIDKSVTAGIIHKNAAANKKSAISKRLSDIRSGRTTRRSQPKRLSPRSRHARRQERNSAQSSLKRKPKRLKPRRAKKPKSPPKRKKSKKRKNPLRKKKRKSPRKRRR